MKNKDLNTKARIYFYYLVGIFALMQILFLTEVELVGNKDILGALILSAVFFIFIGLTIRGYNWAKWVLSVLLCLFAILFLIAGFEIPSIKLKIVGLYYLFFGLIPHFSKHLKPLTKAKKKKMENTKVSLELTQFENSDNTQAYPYLIDRYKALLIDGLLILLFIVICVEINRLLMFNSIWILITYIIIGFSYEPILVTYSATVGQRIMKIRVRNINDPEKPISLGHAYLRFFTKSMLGWLSFITISFNKEKRAIHDFTASSVVVNLRTLPKTI